MKYINTKKLENGKIIFLPCIELASTSPEELIVYRNGENSELEYLVLGKLSKDIVWNNALRRKILEEITTALQKKRISNMDDVLLTREGFDFLCTNKANCVGNRLVRTIELSFNPGTNNFNRGFDILVNSLLDTTPNISNMEKAFKHSSYYSDGYFLTKEEFSSMSDEAKDAYVSSEAYRIVRNAVADSGMENISVLLRATPETRTKILKEYIANMMVAKDEKLKEPSKGKPRPYTRFNPKLKR